MGGVAAWASFFLGGWGTSFSAYLALQALAFLTLRRSFLLVSLLPLVAMAYVAAVTVLAYRQESNMWPMLMILASPIAVLAVAGITIFGLRAQAHPHRARFTILALGIVAFVLAYEIYVYAAA